MGLLLLLCSVVVVAVVIGKECAVCVVHCVYTGTVCVLYRERDENETTADRRAKIYKRQF